MVLTDPTLDALLAAVLAAPDDDLPRLVVADWLDENGQPERAEFIRVQVEVAKYGPRAAARLYHEQQRSRRQGCYPPCVICDLTRRERELYDGWAADGFARFTPGVQALTALALDPTERPSPGRTLGVLRRGFVEAVKGPLLTLVGGECERCRPRGWNFTDGGLLACPACSGTGRTPGVLRAVCAAHPVTAVVVTDREPDARGGVWSWWCAAVVGGDDHLPADVFALLTGFTGVSVNARYYPTLEAAVDALSAALLAFARTPHPTPCPAIPRNSPAPPEWG